MNKIRVIICSDAKNEADDQYALVHALLSKKFIIKGWLLVILENQELIKCHMMKWLN